MFDKKMCNFALSFSCWKPMFGLGGWRYIYIKGVPLRFGFDAIRTSQLQSACQKQSNGNAPWDVYTCSYWLHTESVWLYIIIRGAFSVARFDKQGNAKDLTAWNGWQGLALRSFLYMYKTFNNGHNGANGLIKHQNEKNSFICKHWPIYFMFARLHNINSQETISNFYFLSIWCPGV